MRLHERVVGVDVNGVRWKSVEAGVKEAMESCDDCVLGCLFGWLASSTMT